MTERAKTSHHIQPQHSHQIHEGVRKFEQLAGVLEPIPEGYVGPGVLSSEGEKFPVSVRKYLGIKEEDAEQRHFYGVRLNIGGLMNRLEGGVPGDNLYATPTDIQKFLDEKQQDPQVLIDLSKRS